MDTAFFRVRSESRNQSRISNKGDLTQKTDMGIGRTEMPKEGDEAAGI